MPSTPQQITPSSNIYLDAIQWGGWKWDDGGSAGTNITYFFDWGSTDLFDVFGVDAVSAAWLGYEEGAVRSALQRWANVIDVTFTEVNDYASADLVEYNYAGGDTDPLGSHETPEDAFNFDGTALGAYNYADLSWTSSALRPGGNGFTTLIHELGHALGLAHPHDTGGGSGLFRGVTSEYDFGDNNLNQGIFTTMSYNDGWETGPYGNSRSDNYGWQAGPMAFDIAAAQYLYGANTSYNVTNNVYTLPDANAAGTAWICIWDAGGIDTISYGGTRNVVINLTAATLNNSPSGGGLPSYAANIYGGFTIANRVVIENSIGGWGVDILTGNAAANVLNGRGGNDILDGRGGNDRLIGGAGNDTYVLGNGTDTIVDNGGIDTATSTITRSLASFAMVENLTLLGATAINGTGNACANIITGNGAANVLNGSTGNDILNGGVGNDTLIGGSGNDRLIGGLGKDTMTGNTGADDFDFNALTEMGKTASTRDVIRDFVHLIDDIDLATIDANGSAAGNGAFKFLASEGAAFTGVRGQLRFDQQNLAAGANDRTIVEGDVNGDRVADFQIQLTGLKVLTTADFVL